VIRPGRALIGVAAAGLLAAACSSTPGTHTSSQTTVGHHHHTTTTTGAVTTTSASTTTTTGIGPCTQVNASPGQSQGAAGTIVGTVTLSAAGTTPCTVNGYPELARFTSGGTPVTVTLVHGLTIAASGGAAQPPSSLTLNATQQAEFTYQYSDVPTGNETSCASSASMSVTSPGATTASPVFGLTMAPCDNGTVRVSAIYAAGT
jgi:hypothetical protein